MRLLWAGGMGAILMTAALVLGRPAQTPAAGLSPSKPEADRPTYLSPRDYVCYRASGPIQVDGRLDEESWRKVPWTDRFVDIEGDARPRPRFGTRVKMLWDDEHFYIGAELEEPHVWATLTQHDSVIFRDNDFEVFIDPNGDNHEYYEFEINALNTSWDLLLPRPYKDGGQAVNSWEIPGLKTAVHVSGTINDPSDTDKGWSVELAFPWKVLGELAYKPAPPHDGDHWRVNFSRVEWRHEVVDGKYRQIAGSQEDNWVWSPQGVVDMHRPETWGYVQFSTGAPGQARFQPDPAGPAQHLLHRVYYAQRRYHKEHGRWAKQLEDLKLPALQHNSLEGALLLETTTSGFEVTASVKTARGPGQKWHIRQDARIWSD